MPSASTITCSTPFAAGPEGRRVGPAASLPRTIPPVAHTGPVHVFPTDRVAGRSACSDLDPRGAFGPVLSKALAGLAIFLPRRLDLAAAATT